MLSIATGYNPRYLTGEVAKGTENYYTREVGRGEPPGVWQGRGAAELGLSGQVQDSEMQALFVHFVDPRDAAFRGGTRRDWARAARLGRPPRKYRTAAELLAEALAREPHAEPERVLQLRRLAEGAARKPVAFLDLTFGVPKSFSLLHAALRAQAQRARARGDVRAGHGWEGKVALLEQAIWAGNSAALEFLQEHAGYSRAGYHGARTPSGGTVGRWVDAHGWIVASFLQHTNRNEDMHLHIHNAVLNRVHCADGRWRTLDSRAVHRLRGAAGAIAERVMTEQTVRTLGARTAWSEDGHSLELADVPAAARALFSSRRREVTGAVKVLAARWEQQHGRAPNALELARLSNVASKATRSPKRHAKETERELFDRFDRQLRAEVDLTLHHVAQAVLDHDQQPPESAGRVDSAAVVTAAVERVQQTKSVWTRGDLIRALHEQLPPYLGGLDYPGVLKLLNNLADGALRPHASDSAVICLTPPDVVPVPAQLRLADGRPVFEAPAETVYATRAHLLAENHLIAATTQMASMPALRPDDIDTAMGDLRRGGVELGDDQIAAVRGVLTMPRRVAILVGPAGTGKSMVMGAIARIWEQRAAGRVFGLATAQHAAHLLADEGFDRTDNVTRWLLRQARLDAGQADPADVLYRLRGNDLVVVDEASMTPTHDLAAVEARCALAGARLILVGDPAQLGAVGAGGALRLMTQHGHVHSLAEVRRFASAWEADASLRLRDGDTDVLSIYERHGRIVDSGTAEHSAHLASQAWLADTLAGQRSLLLAGTGEQAADICARLRARLADHGLVADNGVALSHAHATGTTAGVGDIIQTRRNQWTLRDTAGRAVVNRDLWQVTATTADGGLHARRMTTGPHGLQSATASVVLPAAYVSQHVTLGYALTVHAAQGLTVDTCYPIITGRLSPQALYVAMTRGRTHTIAYVVTTTDGTNAESLTPPPTAGKPNADRGDRSTPCQVLGSIMQRAAVDMSALELQRELLNSAGSLPLLGSRWAHAVTVVGRDRLHTILQELVQDRRIHPTLAKRIAGDEAAGTLQQLLRACELAGHHPKQILADAIAERELGTAISPAEVLHWRITASHGQNLTPQGDTWTARTPQTDDPIGRYASTIADVMDARSRQLGEQTAHQPPDWAIKHLGPVPGDNASRQEWTSRAAIVAGYREHDGVADGHHPVGACAHH